MIPVKAMVYKPQRVEIKVYIAGKEDERETYINKYL